MFVALLAAFAVACETFQESFIDPFESDGKYYTVYGALDRASTDHALRVVSLARTPEVITGPGDGAGFLDARVSTTDLTTHQQIFWERTLTLLSDSTKRLPDSTYGHIFSASFVLERGREYRLLIERSDGVQTSALARIPFILRDVPAEVSDVRLDPQGRVVQSVFLAGITRAVDIDVLYDLSGDLIGGGLTNLYRVTIPYEKAGRADPRGGWTFDLELSRDSAAVHSAAWSILTEGFLLNQLGFRVSWVSEEWLPPEDVETALAAQPGRFSNVENGYGFFGALGTETRQWSVPDTVRTVMGFP